MAGVLAVVVLAFTGSPTARPSALGPVLAGLGLLQCALGVILPEIVARPGTKGSALSATLLGAVLLATPAWFLMLALITSQTVLPLITLGAAVFAGYALGFVLTGRFARRVATNAVSFYKDSQS